MRNIRKGILSTIFIIMVMVMAGLPVNAETEWSKECLVVYIQKQGLPPDKRIWYDGDDYTTGEPMMPFYTGDDIGVNLTLVWGNEHPHIGELKFNYTIDVQALGGGGPFYTWYIYIDDLLVRTAEPYNNSCICVYEEGNTTINATIMVDGQFPELFTIYVYYDVFEWRNDEWQYLDGEDYEYFWANPLE